MHAWVIFWCVCLVIAAVSFGGITLAVAWHGIPELRALMRSLSNSSNSNSSEPNR